MVAAQLGRTLPAPLGEDQWGWERASAARGWARVAGVDEAGRGPLAGPVVAAAVVFPEAWFLRGLPDALSRLDDSKRLTARRREQIYEVLTNLPEVDWAVAEVGPAEIDRLNILGATHVAMRQAVERLRRRPGHVLVDGLPASGLGCEHTAIVEGDHRSFSIAAASILAKVTRDRFMAGAECDWPGYGFARHKGYPTAEHREALARLGPCPLHRRSFAPVVQLDLPWSG